jgi:hypothetical protein
MAQVEVDFTDLPPIAAWGPPRDYAPTPGEDDYYGYRIDWPKVGLLCLAFLLNLICWGGLGWLLYSALA